MLRTIAYSLIALSASATAAVADYAILFTKQSGGTDNLYLWSENAPLKQITTHRRKDSSGVLSPDGSMIVFTSERRGWWKIWTMDMKAQTFKQLTFDSRAAYAPSWSPDGKQIAYIATKDGNAEIYVIGKDGQDAKNITNSAADEAAPYWAPNGTIYYSAPVGGTYQIMRMKVDGSAREQITGGPGNKMMPQLSPDGSTLLYYSDLRGNANIYTQPIAGGDPIQLTNNPLGDIRARWSGDGKKIVFERGDKKRSQHIFMMDADGSNVQQLTKDDYNYAPSFAPCDW